MNIKSIRAKKPGNRTEEETRYLRETNLRENLGLFTTYESMEYQPDADTISKIGQLESDLRDKQVEIHLLRRKTLSLNVEELARLQMLEREEQTLDREILMFRNSLYSAKEEKIYLNVRPDQHPVLESYKYMLSYDSEGGVQIFRKVKGKRRYLLQDIAAHEVGKDGEVPGNIKYARIGGGVDREMNFSKVVYRRTDWEQPKQIKWIDSSAFDPELAGLVRIQGTLYLWLGKNAAHNATYQAKSDKRYFKVDHVGEARIILAEYKKFVRAAKAKRGAKQWDEFNHLLADLCKHAAVEAMPEELDVLLSLNEKWLQEHPLSWQSKKLEFTLSLELGTVEEEARKFSASVEAGEQPERNMPAAAEQIREFHGDHWQDRQSFAEWLGVE